ncbi:hypothetical protein [Yinghuangia sp. YIM S10712]|uniref:hypothetical protein n=1 Tax=Yinghuangia sp. YIM S10712 TaxID=3436930 RepID=UPI003F5392C1
MTTGATIRTVAEKATKLNGHTVTIVTPALSITGTMRCLNPTRVSITDNTGTKWTIPIEHIHAIGEPQH